MSIGHQQKMVEAAGIESASQLSPCSTSLHPVDSEQYTVCRFRPVPAGSSHQGTFGHISTAQPFQSFEQFAGSESDPSRSTTSACTGEGQTTPDGCKMSARRPSVVDSIRRAA